MAAGVGFAWTSPFIPKLNGSVDPENNPLKKPTTLLEDSWIASLQSLGAICGPILSGAISSKFGKKKTLLLFSLTVIAADITMIVGTAAYHFFTARFLLGIGTGCVFALVPIYVAEISEVSERGTTSIFITIMMTGFQLVTYVIGPYITIRTMSIINLAPSFLFLFTFGLFVPESPYQLILENNTLEAEKALKKLRGRNDVQKELSEITKTVEATQVEISVKDLIHSPTIRRCLSLSLGLFFFQQFSGILAIISYLQTLFDSTNGAISGDKSVMLVGAVQFSTALLVTKLVSVVGRKKLLLWSFSGLLATLICLVVYFYFMTKGYDMTAFSWLPVVSVCVYMLCFNVGVGPVTWTVHGEIFPENLKSYLSSIAVIFLFIYAFVITLIFPTLQLYLGITWTFCMFAGFVVGAIIFVSVKVQETKDKTFLEIQEMFEVSKKVKNVSETEKCFLT